MPTLQVYPYCQIKDCSTPSLVCSILCGIRFTWSCRGIDDQLDGHLADGASLSAIQTA